MRSPEAALSADERLAEVARILAAGVARLKQRGSEDSWPEALDWRRKTVLSVPRVSAEREPRRL
jgi:hypothetical protein